MRHSLRGAGLVALAASLSACADGAARMPLAPNAVATPEPSFAAAAARPVRISEIHYDNEGTDADEAIEVTGPAGTDLTGWTLVRYNGSNSQVYTSPTARNSLAGPIVASCGDEGTQVVRYNVDGLQNGAPDGVALVNAAGEVVEFISYEGTITAVGGPAAGMTSTDIGASQTNSTPKGQSIQRNGFGGWTLAAETFGACNDQPVTYDGPTTVVITELMGDPLAALSASWGEWFEVHNHGTAPVNLGGWSIRSGKDTPHTIATDVVIPAGGYVVLGRANNEANNGSVAVAYNYFSGNATTIWLDAADWLVLRSPDGVTRDSVEWSSMPTGATRGVRDAAAENAGMDGADAANWGYGTTPYGSGDFGTPGAPNTGLADVAPPVPTGVVRITFSGRSATSDPALPVGFEDQLFARAFGADGAEIPTTVTWSSATPDLASVDDDGVVRALGAGTAVIRATTSDGRVGLYGVPTRIPVASATASYVGNAEFGTPSDADASDDFVFSHRGFTTSFNPWRNTPNWVSYDLEATHFGPEDRCDCFTFDPMTATTEARPITTADYTGAGAYHGYGIDRGHLVRSADRTAGSLDNAHTFYFSNIIPQASDNNQGPWNNLEIALGDRARGGASEVYVIAGVYGSRGTLKDAGKVTIPTNVWKVAVIMPRNRGVSHVDGPEDFELVAVDMPNVAGIRNVDWRSYQTTVDAIEQASGYDLLALLPDHVEWLVEAGKPSPSGASATELITILEGGIRSLVERGELVPGNGSALLDKLAEARAHLAAGNVSDAAGAVRALRNQADALRRGGRLPAEQAGSLQIFASWIVAAIG